jgi:hypothetical protein
VADTLLNMKIIPYLNRLKSTLTILEAVERVTSAAFELLTHCRSHLRYPKSGLQTPNPISLLCSITLSLVLPRKFRQNTNPSGTAALSLSYWQCLIHKQLQS